MAIAIAMPREVSTAAEASVLVVDAAKSSLLLGTCVLYKAHNLTTSSIFRGHTCTQRSPDLASLRLHQITGLLAVYDTFAEKSTFFQI